MSLVLQARTIASAGFLVLAAASLAFGAGCSGKTIGEDLNQKTDPTSPGGDGGLGSDGAACDAIAAVCDPGDVTIGSPSNCTGAGACYSRPGVCGGPALWCERITLQCDVAPACDQGDQQVSVCPPPSPTPNPGGGSTCYARTACGATIECVHNPVCTGDPTCQPGDAVVKDKSQCSAPGAICYASTACGVTIECVSQLMPAPPPVPPASK